MLKQQTNKQNEKKKKHHAMLKIKCLKHEKEKNSQHKTELKDANK